MSRPVPDLIRLFGIWWLRLEARSILVAEGEMSLLVAVDGLQAAAEQYGLVDAWVRTSCRTCSAHFLRGRRSAKNDRRRC
jgi:hypothetical protein